MPNWCVTQQLTNRSKLQTESPKMLKKIIHHWDVIYEKKTSQFPFLGKDVPKGKETVVWKKELSASILETGSTNLTTNFDHIDDTPFS